MSLSKFSGTSAAPDLKCNDDDPEDGSLLPSPNCVKNVCSTGATSSSAFIALIGVKNRIDPSVINYVCSGSLINRRYVVSAATCYDEAKSPISEVVLGAFKLLNINGKFKNAIIVATDMF